MYKTEVEAAPGLSRWRQYLLWQCKGAFCFLENGLSNRSVYELCLLINFLNWSSQKKLSYTAVVQLMETEVEARKNSEATYCFENLAFFRVFAVVPSGVHGRGCAEEEWGMGSIRTKPVQDKSRKQNQILDIHCPYFDVKVNWKETLKGEKQKCFSQKSTVIALRGVKGQGGEITIFKVKLESWSNNRRQLCSVNN